MRRERWFSRLIAVVLLSLLPMSLSGCNKGNSAIPLDGGRVITSRSEIKKETDSIQSILNTIKTKNGYFNIIDGEDTSETCVYNKNGESIAQGSKLNYITVFRNNKTSVRYTDVVDVGSDIDYVALMENSLKLANSGEAKFEKVPTAGKEGSDGFEIYYVYLTGWDMIKKLYTPISEDFANLMIENMKKAINSTDTDITLRFKYVVGKDQQFSAGCELQMKDEATSNSTANNSNTNTSANSTNDANKSDKVSTGKKEYTLWYFDGYLLLYDWELPKEWYSFDFKDGTKSDEMLSNLLKNLDTMFKKYADDNNLPESTEENKTNTEGTKPNDTTNTENIKSK